LYAHMNNKIKKKKTQINKIRDEKEILQ
jgi:hypothetical protein